jgi:hypothetical protein
MKMTKILILSLFITLLTGCKTVEVSLNMMEEIPETKYYTSDIIPAQQADIYGVWQLKSTSGGISGRGYTKDFDYLILKKNGIFGIQRNDSLVAFGKLTLLPNIATIYINAVYCKFDFDKASAIELYGDSEKYIYLANADSLDLISICCDRYNTHFVRKK